METKSAMNDGALARFGYLRVLNHLIRHPRVFFRDLPDEISIINPLIFLGISSLIPGLAAFIQSGENRFSMAAIFTANAFFLPLIGALLGLPAAALFKKGRLNLKKYFTVFALAGGVIGPIVWLPAFSLACESIKWILVGIGLVHACAIKPLQTFLIILSAILLSMALFSYFL